ncbi:hypothetical protein MiSe_72740 [Microseira wollei NIES-4236]|uniref:Uncharacterized protein n=1 Tax=Microseira wollei NIES-4236 TaxID=2530354 RepID=A0AAV3XPN2_9CYAN|nr:hypothetical protein MiSe_72740 [Microseira wollei NIES-4236]
MDEEAIALVPHSAPSTVTLNRMRIKLFEGGKVSSAHLSPFRLIIIINQEISEGFH